MKTEKIVLYLPLTGLVVLAVVLYIPQWASTGHIAVLSDLSFMEKTTLLLTFALASFAAVEGFSTFKRTSAEAKRYQIDDARNELEKAYGPLYTLLNKPMEKGTDFWLDFEGRQKVNEIFATYPFMFPQRMLELWQQKIRSPAATLESSDLKSTRVVNLDAYLELRTLINEEYAFRVNNYRALLGKYSS